MQRTVGYEHEQRKVAVNSKTTRTRSGWTGRYDTVEESIVLIVHAMSMWRRAVYCGGRVDVRLAAFLPSAQTQSKHFQTFSERYTVSSSQCSCGANGDGKHNWSFSFSLENIRDITVSRTSLRAVQTGLNINEGKNTKSVCTSVWTNSWMHGKYVIWLRTQSLFTLRIATDSVIRDTQLYWIKWTGPKKKSWWMVPRQAGPCSEGSVPQEHWWD